MNSNDSVNKFGGFDICQLDHRMKGIFDKVQRTIEGIGVKISRVDGETCKIDKRVEDLKDTEERYHGMTHNKLRRMQSILQEVWTSSLRALLLWFFCVISWIFSSFRAVCIGRIYKLPSPLWHSECNQTDRMQNSCSDILQMRSPLFRNRWITRIFSKH